MGDKRVLCSSPRLIQDIGLPYYILMAVSADHSGVYSKFIARLSRLGFTILCLGITIDDGGTSEKSNELFVIICQRNFL